MDLIGEKLGDLGEPLTPPGDDGIIQKPHGLPAGHNADLRRSGWFHGVDMGRNALPQRQIAGQARAPRGGAGANLVPGFIDHHPRRWIGRPSQPGIGARNPMRVGPLQMGGQRDGFGQDKRAKGARGQHGAGIHPLGPGPVAPIVDERGAVDDLGAHQHRRGQQRIEHARHGLANKGMSHKQHIVGHHTPSPLHVLFVQARPRRQVWAGADGRIDAVQSVSSLETDAGGLADFGQSRDGG